jgi:hypothetical protein
MPNPKGSEGVSSVVPIPLAREIKALAEETGLSRSRYVRALLEDAVKRRRIFHVKHAEFIESNANPPLDNRVYMNKKRETRSIKSGQALSTMTVLAAVAVFAFGCASEPPRYGPAGQLLKHGERVVHIESEPAAARVFVAYAINEDAAKVNRQFIGTAPFDWIVAGNGDGSFKLPGAFIYSSFVGPVAVFTAEPSVATEGLSPQRQVYHGGTAVTPADKIPEGIFFDLRKP